MKYHADFTQIFVGRLFLTTIDADNVANALKVAHYLETIRNLKCVGLYELLGTNNLVEAV